MSKYNKIKKIMEGDMINFPGGDLPTSQAMITKNAEDELAKKTARELEVQRQQDELERRAKPAGDESDKQDRALTDKDGNIIKVADIQDRAPSKPDLVDTDKKINDTSGVGSTFDKVTGSIQSVQTLAKKGAPVIPVENNYYEDEKGNHRQFGKVTTGFATGDPYYFEFDHLDTPNNQHLILYGSAAGTNDPNARGRSIPLKVKAIIPISASEPLDTELTSPTNSNTQKNFNESLNNIASLVYGESTWDPMEIPYWLKPEVTDKPEQSTSPEQSTLPDRSTSRVRIPRSIINHPEIVALLKRYELLDKIDKRVKIGGTYGVLVRKDPRDSNSIWKLTKKVFYDKAKALIEDPEFEGEFEDPNDPGAAAAIGIGAISLAAAESGAVSIGDVATAFQKLAPNAITIVSDEDEVEYELPKTGDQPARRTGDQPKKIDDTHGINPKTGEPYKQTKTVRQANNASKAKGRKERKEAPHGRNKSGKPYKQPEKTRDANRASKARGKFRNKGKQEDQATFRTAGDKLKQNQSKPDIKVAEKYKRIAQLIKGC